MGSLCIIILKDAMVLFISNTNVNLLLTFIE